MENENVIGKTRSFYINQTPEQPYVRKRGQDEDRMRTRAIKGPRDEDEML